MEIVDCIVIGAGVVGLAVARTLALQGYETIVVEAEPLIGSGVSSRSSEVIHAGIYYPPGSLKARLCVEGRQRLYEYCESRGVPHRRCGKLIVATDDEQLPALDGVAAAGAANGVDDLQLLTPAQARALEPKLACHAALLSPSTGIVDSHALMLSLLGEAEDHGAALAKASRVSRGAVTANGVELAFDDANFALRARFVVNAAGLAAATIAASIDGLSASHIPEVRYAKGNYFSLSGPAPFSHLVYPIPEPGGLGVHLTLDMGGQARFGPDVEWIEEPDFTVDPNLGERFYGHIRKYWPDLEDDRLAPAYAGVRPKLSGPGEPSADFRIDGPETHGVAGLVNLFGIESPGLTSSLAIAELVARQAREAFHA